MKVIFNADDFGKSHEINMGVVEGFKRGLLTRTTIMVNMPYADEAVQLAKNNGFFDKVGLHLNLTEGKSITKKIRSLSWIYEKEEYNNKIRAHLRKYTLLNRQQILIIRGELECQIKKYLDYGFPPFHIDSHHHIHNELAVFFIVRSLSAKYNFHSMRILRNLMPTNGIKQRMKSIYKTFMNWSIKSSFDHTEYFGSYEDYCNYINKEKCYTVEVMVHPIIYEGELCDLVDGNLVLMDNYKM